MSKLETTLDDTIKQKLNALKRELKIDTKTAIALAVDTLDYVFREQVIVHPGEGRMASIRNPGTTTMAAAVVVGHFNGDLPRRGRKMKAAQKAARINFE